MAEDDINVVFDADDEGLTAAVKRFQAELQTVDAQAAATGQKISAAFSQMGISPERGYKLANPEDRAALVQYQASLRQVTGATNELSEETQKAGINIESMITRMAARFAIMEVARLAIGGLINAFKGLAELEEARIHFENLTASMYHTVEIEERLQQTTLETGIALKDLTPAFVSLEEAGYGPEQVTAIMDTLAEVTTATAIPAKELGKGLLDLKIDKGVTVDVLFQMAEATGEAKDRMIPLVQQYAELERSIKLAQHTRAEELATMREQVSEQDRLIDAEMRAADMASKAAEKKIADWERVTDTRESFLEKALAAQGKPPGHEDPLLARAMQKGGLPDTPGGKQMTADIAAGFQRIYDEENLTTAGMQHFVDTGQIGLKDILEAAKRLHAAEKEARDEALAKTKEKAEAEKRANQEAVSDLAKRDAATKKQETVELDTTRLSLEKQITEEVLKQENHAKEFAKSMMTIGAFFGTMWRGITTPTREAAGMGDYLAPGTTPGAPSGKLGFKEANSDQIASSLQDIKAALTGSGTP